MREFVREIATKFAVRAGSKSEARNPGEASRRDQFETISNDRISNVQKSKSL
jgi:hypothetical protein